MFDLLLNVGPAIKAIFKMGFEPKEEDFYELTKEQYAKLKTQGTEIICICKNYEEKLYYVASCMPSVFSEGTKFQESQLKRIK